MIRNSFLLLLVTAQPARLPATVRSRLLSAKAEASPEIVSRIAPDASRPAPANPLLEAARNLAAQSSALKKEI